MTLKPWIFVGTLSGLIVGGFLGYKLAPRPAPPPRTNITLDVDQFDNKVNVAPQKGEVVQWIKQSDNTPIAVTFLTDSPCVESEPNSTCTVKVSQGNFQYTCPGCQDPGIDPRTQLLAPGPNQSLLDRFKTYTHDLFGIGKSSDVFAAVVPSETGGQTAKRTPHLDTVNPGIKCGANGAPTVIWDPQHPTDPLPVTIGQTLLHWKGGSLTFTIDNFVIGATPVSVCQETNIDNAHPLCTVIKDPKHKPPYTVTYRVTTSGTNACSTPSGSASLAVSTP